jgi:hypothetical protein
MRRNILVASAIALVTVIAAVWGTIIIAHVPKHQAAASAASSIGVLEMMKIARNLHEEEFDAH